jgi:hypothetical protein
MFLISKKREEKKEKETRILAIVGTKKNVRMMKGQWLTTWLGASCITNKNKMK